MTESEQIKALQEKHFAIVAEIANASAKYKGLVERSKLIPTP